jgi:hypothetical protein
VNQKQTSFTANDPVVVHRDTLHILTGKVVLISMVKQASKTTTVYVLYGVVMELTEVGFAIYSLRRIYKWQPWT